MADLTPERLARLRTWAQRLDANRPELHDSAIGRHCYEGACPWCRGDDLQPGADGYFDGNAHQLALELLDEIERLRHALERARLGWAAADVELKMVTDDDRYRVRAPGGDVEGTAHPSMPRPPHEGDLWIEWDDDERGWYPGDTVERIP